MIKTNIQNKQEKKTRNSRIYKILGLLLIPLLSLIVILPGVMAHCPLCTAATIVGVGVTRSLGWDDVFLRISSITVATFVLTILSFYYAGLFGPANTYRIFGMEKIIFGTISGAVVSFVAFFTSNEVKRRNDGKVLFDYQTIALTFGVLMLNALLFWGIFG